MPKKLTPAERNQSAFDRAVTGVIQQGRPSRTCMGSCLLRGPDNTKCAIGHLIKDDARARELDDTGSAVYTLRDQGEIHPDLDVDMLAALQRAHDNSASSAPGFVEEFKRKCRNIAAEYGLDPTAAQ
jgi:hypothetical protein